MDEQVNAQTGPAADPSSSTVAAPPNARSIAALREMEQESEHLDQTVNDAREAVRAAHEADSMASPGERNGESGEGVVGGDAAEPLKPADEPLEERV